MMKARLAGLILLMGLSMAAQARPHTFAVDDEGQEFRSAFARFAARPAMSGQWEAFARFERGHVARVRHAGGSAGEMFCVPIPEPGTYAMLLAGLGLMTTIARRKRIDG
jgi:hypothetical protein